MADNGLGDAVIDFGNRDDVLNGFAGNDTLFGGAGNDIFIMKPGMHQDSDIAPELIDAFEPRQEPGTEETGPPLPEGFVAKELPPFEPIESETGPVDPDIVVEELPDFASLNMADNGLGDAVIDFGNGDGLTLVGVSVSGLGTGDFIF